MPEPAPSDAKEAGRVGSWVIGPLLAAGGMGSVYLVHHEAMPARRGVLKVMRPGVAASVADEATRRERFHREANVLAKLRHRGCTQLLDFGHGADGMPYMVQEFVAGETLAAVLLREGRLPVEAACRVLGEIADVLLEARRLGISHRDVKPDNIMLAADGAVLVDWGIALDDGAASLTQTNLGLGTLAYIGPEEFDRATADPWKREVYALGVVLLECVSGEPAFPETTAALVARKLKIPHLDAPPGSSPAVSEAIRRATLRDPAERVDLAGLRALLAAESGGGAAASAPAPFDGPAFTTHDAPSRPSRRPPWKLIVAAVILLVPALYCGVFRGEDPPPGTAAPRPALASTAAASPAIAAIAPLAPPEAAVAAPDPPAAAPARRRAAPPPACAGAVTVPDGKWRLRPRGADGGELVKPSGITPCGKYKLLEWDTSKKDWVARRNINVKDGGAIVCDTKLRCRATR